MNRSLALSALKHICRRALTLVELLVIVLLLGIVLFASVGATRSMRASMQQQAAVDLLILLDRAADIYRHDTGSFPPAADDASCEPVVSALVSYPPTRKLLAQVPGGAWVHSVPPRVVDPWATPLRYIGPSFAPARVAAHDGRPIFLSAGPDRSFGDHTPAALGDNLASDDPAVRRSVSASQPRS